MRLNKGFIFSIFLLVFILGFLVFVFATEGIFISTDKLDYAPEETVLISGDGFSAASETTPVQIQVTRPDSTVHVCPDPVWCPASLPTTTSFTDYLYQLDGIEGTYIIDATDSVNTAQMTFTDNYYYACSQSCSSSSNCLGFSVDSYWYYSDDGTGSCGDYHSVCVTCDKRCKYDRKVCADSSAADNVPSVGGSVRTASAACDQDSDCSCPSDGCVGTTYYDYPSHGDCSSYSCSCDIGTGSGDPCHYISHTHDDLRCTTPT